MDARGSSAPAQCFRQVGEAVIRRSRRDVPPILAPGSPQLAREERRLRAHYEAIPAPDKNISVFRLYNDAAVKAELNRIFDKKCAFCEATEVCARSNVEHWRPKGKVDPRLGPPHPFGYWWLATSWDNLLLSCQDCNIKSKRNQFPILAGQMHAVHPGDEVNETPLLLDPTVDDPSLHLLFIRTTQASKKYVSIVIPTIADPLGKGQVSIDVYDLNRREIANARTRHLLQLELNLGPAGRSFLRLWTTRNVAASREDLRQCVEELREVKALYTAPDSAFSAAAMTRYLEWSKEVRSALRAIPRDT